MRRRPYLPEGYVFLRDPDAPRLELAATKHVVARFGPGVRVEEVEEAAWDHRGRVLALSEKLSRLMREKGR